MLLHQEPVDLTMLNMWCDITVNFFPTDSLVKDRAEAGRYTHRSEEGSELQGKLYNPWTYISHMLL